MLHYIATTAVIGPFPLRLVVTRVAVIVIAYFTILLLACTTFFPRCCTHTITSAFSSCGHFLGSATVPLHICNSLHEVLEQDLLLFNIAFDELNRCVGIVQVRNHCVDFPFQHGATGELVHYGG